MKTRLIGEFQRELRFATTAWQIAFVLVFTSLVSFTTQAADSGYETMLRQQKRDFERYISNREKKSDSEIAAARALSKVREAREKKQAEVEARYSKTMKRYSMEEIEKRDREDEERLAKLSNKNNLEREKFVDRRDQRRELEAEIQPVDTYREFDINMSVAPEFKSSHTESKSQQ